MPPEDGDTEEPIAKEQIEEEEEEEEKAFDAESKGLEMLPDDMRIGRIRSTWLFWAAAAQAILLAAAEAVVPGTEGPSTLVEHLTLLLA